jgi:uncharacterized membrane protein
MRRLVRRLRPAADRRRDERGAILPMVALLTSVLTASAALCVDLGQLRVGRADMQAMADVVALDLAREIDGRQAQVISADPEWGNARTQSVARNGATFGTAPSVTAELGTFDTTTGVFTPVGGATVPTAVRVTASTSVKFAFRYEDGNVTRRAVAMADSTACFMLGSYAAAVRSGRSALLSSVLGQVSSSLDLGTVGYTGLLDANVSLADLAAGAGVATVQELASSTMSVKDLYLATASALTTGGNAVDANVLNVLAGSVASLGSVQVGKVLQADTATTRGIDAKVNAIDVIAGSAMLFTGSNAVTVPTLTAAVPALGSATSSFSIVETPQMACSRANSTPSVEAKTSQVTAAVGGTLSDTTISAVGVGTKAGSPAGKPVGLTLSLASASGHLTSISCENVHVSSSADSITVATTSGLMSADLTVPLAVSGKVSVPALGLGLVSFTITVDVKVSASSAAGTTHSTTITVPPQAYDTAYSAGSGSLALATGSVTRSGLVVNATLLGVPVTLPAATVDTILSAATTTVVTPLVNTLDSQVVMPLADLVGARIAGADLIALSEPNCSVPVLRQ